MIRLTLKKTGVSLAAFGLFLFANNSTGFDFYSHTVSYYFYNQPLNYSDILFDEIILPRYMLLSVLYEIFSRIGIPIGYLSSFILALPLYYIGKNTSYDKSSLIEICILIGCLVLSFFYSGLSVVLLWFVAYLKSEKKLFLMGCVLHPVGVIIFLAGSLLTSRKSFYYVTVILFFTLSIFYIFTNQSELTSFQAGKVRYTINIISIYDIFLRAIEHKIQEVSILLSIVMFVILGRSSILEKINIMMKITLPRRFVLLICISMCISVGAIMSQKNTLFSSIYSLKLSPVIYAAWFDWGEKDMYSSETPSSLTYLRYN